MARKKQVTFWACDFETTVWGKELESKRGKKQDSTEVWSAASVKLYDETETVIVDHSIRDFVERFLSDPGNNILYFHNLSFDGSFLVSFLLENGYKFTNDPDKEMKSRQFKTSISHMGSWYYIKIKKGHTFLEIRDSLKLIPTSLANMARSFQTKHQKLDMVYEGDRHAYCQITAEELKYIENDVLVLKEGLEKMFNEGHDKLTIGSCCLEEFKKTYTRDEYEKIFPDLRKYLTDLNAGFENAWEFVHKSYHGGWCYVNPKYAHILIKNGRVYDVNSLYPSVMHSSSGNPYPVGEPCYFKGMVSDEIRYNKEKYYFLKFKCRFNLKPNSLPWVHIRKNALYKGNENLVTSDVRYKGKYHRYYRDLDGNQCDTNVTLTMTGVDFQLFLETYDISDFEPIEGVWFYTQIGLFDDYINHYKKIKMESKGFKRESAKLFLNNLYGKLAMSDDSSYKEPFLDEDGILRFILREEHNKKVGYIPCGSAVTSYALNFTIRAALKNIERFCYADTDSVHLIGLEEPVGIPEHPYEFCHWKNEGVFDVAYYERQKVYAEHMVEEDHHPVKPYLLLKCAGMSKNAKEEFRRRRMPIQALREGLELEECNLKANRVKGGVLLTNKTFKMHSAVDKKVII